MIGSAKNNQTITDNSVTEPKPSDPKIAPLGLSPDAAALKPAKPLPGQQSPAADPKKVAETGGPKGPEPTRFGDWERKGRCSDF